MSSTKPFREGTVGWYLTAAGYKPKHKNSAVICWFTPLGQEVSTKDAWATLRAQLWPDYTRIERERKREQKQWLSDIKKGKGIYAQSAETVTGPDDDTDD